MEASELVLIMPRCQEREKTRRMNRVLAYALQDARVSRKIETARELVDLKGKKLLFAVMLGESGINLEYCSMLKRIRLEKDLFEGCQGAVIVDGLSELFTKSVSRSLVLAANRAGCAFIGRPLVEGTRSLANFHVLAKQGDTDPLQAYFHQARELVGRLLEQQPPFYEDPRLLVLHASSRKTSNTMALWDLVKKELSGWRIREIPLRNGALVDCAGCSYTTCMYFGQQGGCFYGGVMVEEVYPAVMECDALLLLCPNYNDALSANLTAFINRLTALYRQRRFYDKRLYGIVVSGYSGSDLIAEQLIAALCMNKSFYLPPGFCMMETANDPGSILKLPGIQERAGAFSEALKRMKKG